LCLEFEIWMICRLKHVCVFNKNLRKILFLPGITEKAFILCLELGISMIFQLKQVFFQEPAKNWYFYQKIAENVLFLCLEFEILLFSS